LCRAVLYRYVPYQYLAASFAVRVPVEDLKPCQDLLLNRTFNYLYYNLLGIPPAETFSFVFNTLLNDIATHNPAWADRIIDTQVHNAF
jgi:hypothetical protein